MSFPSIAEAMAYFWSCGVNCEGWSSSPFCRCDTKHFPKMVERETNEFGFAQFLCKPIFLWYRIPQGVSRVTFLVNMGISHVET